MKRSDLFALLIVIIVLLGLPIGLFGYQAMRTRAAGVRVIDIIARTPESGGFTPDHLQLQVGETVRLRISSPDAVHGFWIPGLGVNVDEIYPGKVVEVDLTPAKPGRYAFACTRWCGIDHWRMRGVIDVTGTASAAARPTDRPPLFQQLGINLDAKLHAVHATPSARPSIAAGATLNVKLPQGLADPAARRALAPADAFGDLRADPANVTLSDSDVWDLVAWAWLKETAPQKLARAETLYARDCAACHGPEGKGNGPAGVKLPGMAKMDPTMPKGPADFTDPAQMLAASDVLLQGKLLRGGMGTGMPEFGSLYTDEELWAMIAYLRTFLFKR